MATAKSEEGAKEAIRQKTKQNMEEAVKDHLTKIGLGYPKRDDFIEFLRMCLTDEEFEVISGLPTRVSPHEVEDVDIIVERLGRERGMLREKAEQALESLSKKGFAYRKITHSGRPGYGFIQPGFGMPQIALWKGEHTAAAKKITEVFKGGLRLEAHFQGSKSINSFTYLPVDRSVDYAIQGVLPYEQMAAIIEKVEIIAVAHCPCRVMQDVQGARECTHTLEACLKFNDTARFVIERGLAREISKEEALQIIRNSEEEGLMHFVDSCTENIQHNCNCCACCCWNAGTIKKKLVPRDSWVDTYFLRETNLDDCIEGCELCKDACGMEAIALENGYPVVDHSLCLGCGVCLLACPAGAAYLKRREDKRPPFGTFKELHDAQIREVLKSESKERDAAQIQLAAQIQETGE